MKDVTVGDKVFTKDGKETEVTAVFPQSNKKTIWRVTFADRRITECCGDHL